MIYYDLKITGKDVKRFINSLYKMHINFFEINYFYKYAIVRVNKKDYLKIKKIKTIYDIKIVKYYGLAKYIYYFNKYKVFFLIMLIGFTIFLGLTNIIFEIDINSNNKELKNLILLELEENGISKYKMVKSFSKKEKMKERILKKYNDKIEWLEIKRIGTKYEIELEERRQKISNLDETPRNIVAKKNGLITKITSTSGEVVGKINHYVKKGDILISGSIHKKEDIVASVKAEGKVFAETWYTVTVELPYHYQEEIKLDRKEYSVNIDFLNKKISLFEFKHFKNKKIIPIFSLKNSLLPIQISIDKLEETKVIDNVYTEENAYFKASEIATSKLKGNLGEDIQIIFEKKLKTREINSKIEVVIFYKIIEDITDYSDIELQEENNEEIR